MLVEVAHHVPGRLRVRIPGKRHDTVYFHQVKQHLESLDAIDVAHVNPAAGSVALHYSGEIGDVLAQLAEQGLAELLEFDGIPAGLVDGAIEACDGVGGHVFGLLIMAVVAAMLGVYRFA